MDTLRITHRGTVPEKEQPCHTTIRALGRKEQQTLNLRGPLTLSGTRTGFHFSSPGSFGERVIHNAQLQVLVIKHTLEMDQHCRKLMRVHKREWNGRHHVSGEMETEKRLYFYVVDDGTSIP